MAQIITMAEFTNHVSPLIRGIIIDEGYQPDMHYWPSIVNYNESDLPEERIAQETSFGYAVKRPENAPITFDKPIQGPVKVLTAAFYALGFQISQRAQYFGRWRDIGDYARSLGESLKETKEVNVWLELVDGDTVSTLPNGEYVFSNSHSIVRGGSQSNLLNAALSYSSLDQMLGMIASYKDPRGFPAHLKAATLWVHPKKYTLACEILRSPERPDTANRAKAMLYHLLEPRWSPYLTSEDDWFIQCHKHGFEFYQQFPFTVDFWWDGDTKAYKVSVEEGYSYGFVSDRGWFMGYV